MPLIRNMVNNSDLCFKILSNVFQLLYAFFLSDQNLCYQQPCMYYLYHFEFKNIIIFHVVWMLKPVIQVQDRHKSIKQEGFNIWDTPSKENQCLYLRFAVTPLQLTDWVYFLKKFYALSTDSNYYLFRWKNFFLRFCLCIFESDTVKYHETSLSPPVILLLTIPKRCFFCGSFFVICVCLWSSVGKG